MGAHVAGIGVHDPQPGQAGGGMVGGDLVDLGHHSPDQAWKGIPFAAIAAVGRRVLGDQDDLFDAIEHQFGCILYDRFGWPAGGRALDQRNGTEGAVGAAAIGDLEVRAGSLACHAGDLGLFGQRRIPQQRQGSLAI